MANRRGMTLVEILIAITIFSLVMAGALSFLIAQSRGFDRNQSDMGMLQNLRFARDLLEQEIRLAGANVPYQQPVIVYGGTNSMAVNADYASNTDSLFAVYYDPGLLAGQVNALGVANRITIPGSSPGFQYPDTDYKDPAGNVSPAETITWYFAPDTSTGVAPNAYILYRQVNNGAPEVMIRNVFQTTGKNFFKYYKQTTQPSGQATLDSVPTGWMPVKNVVSIHGSVADTGVAAHNDSLRVVEINYTVSNGELGAKQRTRAITFAVPMPNISTKKVTSCGAQPIPPSGLGLQWVIDSAGGVPTDTVMFVTWAPSTDETGGEKDVLKYVIWRRNVGASTWGDPIASVPSGFATPSYTDQSATPGAPGYQYAVAAQDCTPSLSNQLAGSAPLTPP